jgi:hypothetical protein
MSNIGELADPLHIINSVAGHTDALINLLHISSAMVSDVVRSNAQIRCLTRT